MRGTWITGTVGAALLLAQAGRAQVAPQGAQSTIAVDTGTVYQTIDQFGSSQRVFDDPHVWRYRSAPNDPPPPAMTPSEQDEVLDLLYRHSGLTYLRISTDGGLEPSHGHFDYDGRHLDAQIEIALRAQQRGPVKIAFTILVYPPERWMTNSVSDYADYYVAVVNRAKAKGLTIDYLTFNEPVIPPDLMRDVIRSVTRRVPPTIRWILPESKRPSLAEEYLPVLLGDKAVRSVTAAAATHLYADERLWSEMSRLQALVDRYKVPLWMSEFSGGDPWEWAALQHRLIVTYGVSAVDYMWGFFGAYDAAQLLVLTSDSNGRYLGVHPRKQFAVMGQWSRYVKPGARRVAATSDDDTVLVSAFSSPDQTVLVACNLTAVDRPVKIHMPGAQVESVRTSASEDLAPLPQATLADGELTTTLPAKSITTFVTGSAR
jgi:Glycosyl hydrolase family 30 beta sandwich domain